MSRRRSSYSRAAARRRREATLRRKRWQRISTLVVLLLAAVAIFLAVATYRPTASAPDGLLPRDVPVAQAYELYQQGVFLLDVRTPSEWQAGHVPGAVLVPLDELPARLGELPRGEPILVICRSGNRSQAGRDILLQAGFENVGSVDGGISAWMGQGYPIEP